MIKLKLETEDKEKPIIQECKTVAVPAFTKAGFKIVEEKHTVKEMITWMKKSNVKFPVDFPEKPTAEQLAKLL